VATAVLRDNLYVLKKTEKVLLTIDIIRRIAHTNGIDDMDIEI